MFSGKDGKKDKSKLTKEDLLKTVPEEFLPNEYKKNNAEQSAASAPMTTEELKKTVSATRPEDIIWTDPDDPYGEKEGASKELEQVLAEKTKGPWELSYSEGVSLAKQSNKPVLLWFTSSKNSPNCKTLNAEVFNTTDFETWSTQNFVKIKIDLTIEDKFATEEVSNKIAWLNALEKRFNVHGTPVVIVMTSGEKVLATYRGYKGGDKDFYLGRIKQAAAIAKAEQETWKSDLKSQGYRDFTDKKGRAVFAKLTRYENGTLYMVEPDGRRLKTSEEKLSAEDQGWIAEEKAKRAKKL